MLIVKFKNVTGSFDVADYHFTLWVNETMQFVGFIKGFRRADGYAALMRGVGHDRDGGLAERAQGDWDGTQPEVSAPAK